jgi:Transglutaminase-like superfamily
VSSIEERRRLPALARFADPARLSPRRKLALVVETLAGYVRVRRALRRGDIRTALSRLREPAEGGEATPAAAHLAGLRLAAVVARVLTRLPADSRCLMTSLVLCTLLARRGVHSSVVIGVRPGTSFGAHAWVELDGRPLLPANETEFERLVAL